MRGAIPTLPQCFFMAWWLVKHRGNFTLLFNGVVSCRTLAIIPLSLRLNHSYFAVHNFALRFA
jgi:hypothetical protein